MTKPRRPLVIELALQEAEARNYLARLRWPGEWTCPRCSAGPMTVQRERQYIRCLNRHDISLTTRTGMHQTQTPLWKWIEAARLVAGDDALAPKVSGPVLADSLDLYSEPAWRLLRKLVLARSAVGADADRMLKWILDHDPKWPPAEERTADRRSEIGRMGAQARFNPPWMRSIRAGE